MAGDRRRLRGAERRPLRGYAPLVVLVAALVVDGGRGAEQGARPSSRPPTGGGRPPRCAVGEPATGWDETVTACADRELQVPEPRLLAALLRVHRATTAARPPGRDRRHHQGRATACTADPNLLLLLGQLGGVQLDESTRRDAPTTPRRSSSTSTPTSSSTAARSSWSATTAGARSSPSSPGGGQDAATNDSLRVANEIGAFADIIGALPALRRRADPQRGRRHRRARTCRASGSRRAGPTPGARSPTAPITAETSAIYANRRLFGRDADHAGGDLAGEAADHGGDRPQQPRVPAVRRHVRGADRARRATRSALRPATRSTPPAEDPGGEHHGQGQERGRHLGVVRVRRRSCRCTWPRRPTPRATTPSG